MGENRNGPALGPGPGQQSSVTGFLGGVVADEPLAALTARNVLAAGGNAADAAVAAALTMTVTYPSRAGLGGGGACLAYSPKRGNGAAPEAIVFPVTAGVAAGTADRPAGVPLMARGLYLLQARHGSAPFEVLLKPAEDLARGGVSASRAFVQDLKVVAGPLRGDPVAAAIFLPGGQPLAEGQAMIQQDLASTLAQLRTAGVGDLYQGVLARQFAQAAQDAGGGIVLDDLRASLPRALPTLGVSVGSTDMGYFAPVDGGLAAAVAFRALQANPAALDSAGRLGLGAASRLRREGGDAAAILAAWSQPAPSLPALPASAGLAVLDRDGDAVVCNFTMNNLFGTGRIAGRTGVLLAASPRRMPPALLSAGMVVNPNLKAFHAMASGTGQEGAPLAAAAALSQAVRSGQPMPAQVPDPGRANAVVCGRYLPGSENSCNWAVDPRSFGIAVGSN